MNEIVTTLNKIRAHHPCADGWAKLLAGLGKTKADDEPLPLVRVLEINGLDDALWCLRVAPEHANLWRHYAVDCAEDIAHLITDERSREALRVARRHADGLATDADLAATWAAARVAAGIAAGAAAGIAPAAARRLAVNTAHSPALASGVLAAPAPL